MQLTINLTCTDPKNNEHACANRIKQNGDWSTHRITIDPPIFLHDAKQNKKIWIVILGIIPKLFKLWNVRDQAPSKQCQQSSIMIYEVFTRVRGNTHARTHARTHTHRLIHGYYRLCKHTFT